MTKRNDKRTRLIQAANRLFQEQGVKVTTLANIAQLAEVPLGNVYYYFKSKESIIMTVIEYRRQQLKALFSSFEQSADPKVRLNQLIHHALKTSEDSLTLGDALGSLCQELSRQGGELASAATSLMNEMMSWVEGQFKAMGKTNDTRLLAAHLVSGLQGTSLLGVTLADHELLDKQAQSLNHWVAAQ